MNQPWFTIRWHEGAVELLDQRLLPSQEVYLHLTCVEDLSVAIETLAVRGAPAIGCAAALGVALGAEESQANHLEGVLGDLREVFIPRIERTRPTAVNLFWALRRMEKVIDGLAARPDASVQTLRQGLVAEAERIVREDVEICRTMGRHGASLVGEDARILTHCNAGGLATAGYGTALGVIRAAVEAGRRVSVIADETRPLLQGARLTAWELSKDGIEVTVCTDSMSGHLMRLGEIDLVVVGADRVAANGDVANKIGTYGVAVLAHAHNIPFYVAAPLSTIDLAIPNGDSIPIEQRGRDEIARLGSSLLVPDGVDVRQPAFDVTPAHLVSALVTERGVVSSPTSESIKKLFSST
ncbi:MAG: S-methyl-5-thioribose-1-phosphate isomerase [Myxococcota bacterium]|nr:S-methyl-5-thioribose-1-phosphate isomerase [Deltaproteobacteria bacterium]